MQVIIDRYEGNYAVVELPDKSTVDVPKVLFPGSKAGEVIQISFDRNATAERKENIKKLMDELWMD